MEKRKVEAEAEMERLKGEIAAIIGDVPIGAKLLTMAFKNLSSQRPGTADSQNNRRQTVKRRTMKPWCV